MRSLSGVLIFIGILLVIDLYVFKGIRLLSNELSRPLRLIWHIGYWVISLGVLAIVIYAILQMGSRDIDRNNKLIFYSFGVFLLFFLPKLVFFIFHFVEDISAMGIRGWNFFTSGSETTSPSGPSMKRITFISKIGLTLAAIPLAGVAYGVLKGRYDFRFLKKTLKFPHLPSSFDGLRVVQISDLHLGSFFDNKKEVLKGFEMINSLNPDLILITGDLVNNYAHETRGWVESLAGLKAKVGKYAVLGNHDYGDYVHWDSLEDREANLNQLKTAIKEMGFKLLLNENVKLENNGEFIEIIGVENWGKGGFAKYGDLNKAMAGTTPNAFKLLLSHDPSHWDYQVLSKTNIDLTLSGHTHGMQFGIEVPGIKWSPAQYRYPRWGGLYTEGKQHLYVNRGFGYIGFPGRVGISPEITLITLKRS